MTDAKGSRSERSGRGGGPSRALPVLVNSAARHGDRRGRSALLHALANTDQQVSIRPVPPEALGVEVKRLANRGSPVVGVAGGDGSLRTAADILAGRPTVLAPFPLGTLNHFARRGRLDTLERASDALARGDMRKVAVGVLDDCVFLNTATVGTYAPIVERRERWRRWLGKWPAAVLAAAVTLARPRLIDLVLEIDGVRHARTTPLLWIGVGRNTFPYPVRAPLEEAPSLEVVVFRASDRRSMMSSLVRLLLPGAGPARPSEHHSFEVFRPTRLLLHAGEPLGVTLDGERRRLHPPLFIGLQPGALNVICGDRNRDIPASRREKSERG